jgi:hypothetical protein
MANWSLPSISDTYTNIIAYFKNRDTDLALGLDPATTTPTNLPTNALRWNSANNYWEKYNGSAWAALSSNYGINVSGLAASATILATGRTISITGDGTGTSGSFNGSANASIALTLSTVTAAKGGTGQAGGYAIGDMLYAGGASTLSKLAAVAVGNALISGGVTTAPVWGKVTLTGHVSGTLPIANGGTNITTYTTGDILYSSGTNVLSKLAAVAAGNVLISGTTPSWGKVVLTTHVSGTLPVANGGTGGADAATARANLVVPTRTGGDASGSWGISVTGSSASCTGNAATATNATEWGGAAYTVSTSAPTGGADGDFWFEREA